MAIQMSPSPPMSLSPGVVSNQATASVMMILMPMAPAVPQMMALRCRVGGKLRAASAMTMALSPASTRSSKMMDRRAQNQAADRNSMMTLNSINNK